MEKTISQIYSDYNIMPNLQLHQLRVAAIGAMICDAFPDELDVSSIITTLLLHDMGNIIKFDLEKFPQYLEPEGLEYWLTIQDRYKENYGTDEHRATLAIIGELGCAPRIKELVASIGFTVICDQVDHDDIERKIVAYCDRRVGPHGVMTISGRTEEGRKRYGYSPSKEGEQRNACALRVEEQIFARLTLTPEDITNETIQSYSKKLRDFSLTL